MALQYGIQAFQAEAYLSALQCPPLNPYWSTPLSLPLPFSDISPKTLAPRSFPIHLPASCCDLLGSGKSRWWLRCPQPISPPNPYLPRRHSTGSDTPSDGGRGGCLLWCLSWPKDPTGDAPLRPSLVQIPGLRSYHCSAITMIHSQESSHLAQLDLCTR